MSLLLQQELYCLLSLKTQPAPVEGLPSEPIPIILTVERKFLSRRSSFPVAILLRYIISRNCLSLLRIVVTYGQKTLSFSKIILSDIKGIITIDWFLILGNWCSQITFPLKR